MKNIEIKDGGSFWKLVTLWGSNCVPSDGCSLITTIVQHILVISFVSALLGLFLGDLVASAAAMITTGTLFWGKSLLVLTILLGMLTTALVCVTPLILVSDANKESTNPVMKSIYNVKTIHKGWKDKFCPMVEVVDK